MTPAGSHSIRTSGRESHVLLVGEAEAFVERTGTALTAHAPGLDFTVASDAEAALDSVASTDCVVVGTGLEQWTRVEFVEAIRERDPTVPIVVVVDDASATSIDTMLSAGATDVLESDASGALIAARLHNTVTSRRYAVDAQQRADETHVDVTGHVGLQRELETARESLRGLYRVTTDASHSLDERIEKTLQLACDRLDVRLGFVTRITDDTQHVVHAVGDHPLLQPGSACPLSKSYCRRTIETDGLLAVVDPATDSDWKDDPGYELFGLECYLGGKVCVDDDQYGTLCFADTEPREEPFTESQTAFVELLTRWISYELERERSERNLRTATRRFRAMFDNPRTFAAVLDRDGTVREVNNTALATLENPESVTDQFFWEAPWWTPDDEAVETVRNAVAAAAAGDTAPFECAYFHREGSGTVSATIYPVYGVPAEDTLTFDGAGGVDADDTEVVSLMAVGTDTTTRTEQAEQLRRQRDHLEEFASVVSHDLRSPLEVARGRLHLYETTNDSEHLQQAMDSIDRMSALIDDLLELARQGEAVSDAVPTPVNSVARHAWSTVKTDGATLALDVDPELTVDADQSRFRQLFENLFRNSVEHGSTTPPSQARSDNGEHGTTVDAESGPVSIRVVELDSRPGFAVEDDGVGIDPDDREHIFDRGFTTNETGTGFGLAIVARVVEAHGWDIEATESDTGGARFEVSFGS